MHLNTSLKLLSLSGQPEFVRDLGKILEPSGFACEHADDFTEFLRKAQTGNPHVLLLEIAKLGPGGYEACEALRAAPWTAAALLIAWEPDAGPYQYQRALRCGCDFLYAKHDPLALAAIIREAIIER